MSKMKSLAVIPVALGVVRAELLSMNQHRDESFRTFSSRVQGKAETCAFMTSTTCICGLTNDVDYTEKIVSDVLLAGVYDTDIRRDILGIDKFVKQN